MVITSQLRIFDAAHAAKLRSDLEGTTVFVASYPEYAAEADLLGVPPSNRVFADAPVLVHLLRRRGVALGSLATHNDTATPAAHNLNSNTNALNEAGVARGFWQWALLDLALAAFGDRLAAGSFDVVARARTDLDESAALPYASLDPAPGVSSNFEVASAKRACDSSSNATIPMHGFLLLFGLLDACHPSYSTTDVCCS